MRNVVSGGIALTARVRRPTAPHSTRPAPASADLPAPSPASRPRLPRRPRAAALVQPANPARSGWLARWFRPRRQQPVWFGRPPSSGSDDAPFTPEAYPGLSPEACAFFNTPVEECDPDDLRMVLAAFAAQMADSLPPELGMDAKALFASLCDRLGGLPGEAGADAPPPEMPPPNDAEQPESPLQEQVTAAADDAAVPPTTAPEPAPNGVCVSEPAFPDGGAPSDDSRSLSLDGSRSPLDGSHSLRHLRRPLLRYRFHGTGHGMHRALPDARQTLPPRRLCYAACAGPP